MTSENDKTAEYRRQPGSYQFWLPPILAFAGLGLLLALGGENWLYPLPVPHPNYEVLPVTGSVLRGEVEFPHNIQSGGDLRVHGLLQSVDPSVQPKQIALYLDNKPVAVTEIALRSSEGQNAKPWYWHINLLVKGIPPGEHFLLVRALGPNRAAVDILQTTVRVLN
ncbi:MAG: hypothetical protein DMG67_12635 [Acidobacteria bacterium]|nr:MAG: hypothetical protein DMG67_12635 [Acidobacteriota bacterium]